MAFRWLIVGAAFCAAASVAAQTPSQQAVKNDAMWNVFLKLLIRRVP